MPSGGLFARTIDTMFSSSDTHCVDQIIARIDAGDESNDHLGTLRAKCDVPVAYDCEEDQEFNWYFARGQKLVRQENWEQLGQEIRQFDDMRAMTTGGTPIACILTKGAREDILSPIEKALRDKDGLPRTAGFAEYHEIMREYSTDYGIAAILAYAHIDAGWAWHDYAPHGDNESFLKTYRRHFSLAQEILNNFNALELGSPILASAQCAALPGLTNPHLRAVDDYEDLLNLDPTTPRNFFNFGMHLLPKWFGSYDLLDTQARRLIDDLDIIWGNGAYALTYTGALNHDLGAIEKMDTDLFLDSMLDIFERRTDQHTINYYAAFVSLTLGDHSKRKDSKTLRRKRHKILEAVDYIFEEHLNEIHPLLWYDAAVTVNPNLPNGDENFQKALGERIALEIMASRKRG